MKKIDYEIKSYDELLIDELDTSSSGKISLPPYHTQIALYATGNCGKTSALWLTILQLAHGEPYYDEVYKLFIECLGRTRGNSIIDVRIAFPKNGKMIYISTIGDLRRMCEANMYFFLDDFYHKFDTERNYYVVGNKVVKSAKLKVKSKNWCDPNLQKIFISPSHVKGGTVASTMYTTGMFIEENIGRAIWLHKPSMKPATGKLFSKTDKLVADNIEELINRVDDVKNII